MADFHMCRVIDPSLVDMDSLRELLGTIDGLPVVFVSALLLPGASGVEGTPARVDHSVLFPITDWPESEARNRCDGIFFTSDELDSDRPGSMDPIPPERPAPGTANGGGGGGTGDPGGQASSSVTYTGRIRNPARGVQRRIVAEPVSIGIGPPIYARQPGGATKRKAGNPTIEGIAAVYYDGTPRTEYTIFPGLVERIMPGAFDDVIANDSDVLALFNHDRNQLLGRTAAGTLTIRSVKKGLAYRIIPGATTIAGDVLEHVSRRDVTGSSFSFEPLKETWIRDTARELDVVEVDLVALGDVGPVTLPAYKATEAEVSRARLARLFVRLASYRARAESL